MSGLYAWPWPLGNQIQSVGGTLHDSEARGGGGGGGRGREVIVKR